MSLNDAIPPNDEMPMNGEILLNVFDESTKIKSIHNARLISTRAIGTQCDTRITWWNELDNALIMRTIAFFSEMNRSEWVPVGAEWRVDSLLTSLVAAIQTECDEVARA